MWKAMATVSFLIILHYIFYSQEKKEMHAGLEQLEGEYIFDWTIPLST